MNTQALALASLSVNESWSDIRVGSGSNQSPEKDQPSSSPSQAEVDSGRRRRQVLIVEDNRADVFLIRESVEGARLNVDLHVVHDGDKAIRFFEQADRDPAAPLPDLIILDINLPRRSGREVVNRMRQSSRCGQALVVVVTSSDSERDREEMGKFGIDAYFRKPSEYAAFMKLGELVKQLLADRTPQ
jgi:CheY-like chemotaxis protein